MFRGLPDVTAAALVAGGFKGERLFAHDPCSDECKAKLVQTTLEKRVAAPPERRGGKEERQYDEDAAGTLLAPILFFKMIKAERAAMNVIQEIEEIEEFIFEEEEKDEGIKEGGDGGRGRGLQIETGRAFKALVQEQLDAVPETTAEENLIELSAPSVSMIVDLGTVANISSNNNAPAIKGSRSSSPSESTKHEEEASTSASLLPPSLPPPTHTGAHKGIEMSVRELVALPTQSAMDVAADLEIEGPLLDSDFACTKDEQTTNTNINADADADADASTASGGTTGGGSLLKQILSEPGIQYHGKLLADDVEESAEEEDATRIMLEDLMKKVGVKGEHVMDRAVAMNLSVMASDNSPITSFFLDSRTLVGCTDSPIRWSAHPNSVLASR